jgi:regulatory protein
VEVAPEVHVGHGGGERGRAVDLALRALARRDHSTLSLRNKMERAGIPASAQDSAVEMLVQAGYLDDERFARDRAVLLAERGYGDRWIRADLEVQGVARDTVEVAIGSLETERERALREAVKLGSGPRAARSLARRGFSEESLEAVSTRTVADDP